MNDLHKKALEIAKAIQNEVPRTGIPTEIGSTPKSEQVLASSVVKGTREYIEQVVNQINGCYEDAWFDACAVMVRRLIETLIIEVYESYGLSGKIKNPNGDFLFLKDLIKCVLSESTWNLSRNAKSSLRTLKNIGDLSAHNRRYIAHRSDIDRIIPDIRVVVQEFLYLSRLK